MRRKLQIMWRWWTCCAWHHEGYTTSDGWCGFCKKCGATWRRE